MRGFLDSAKMGYGMAFGIVALLFICGCLLFIGLAFVNGTPISDYYQPIRVGAVVCTVAGFFFGTVWTVLGHYL